MFVKAIQFLQIMKLVDCIMKIVCANECVAGLIGSAEPVDLASKQLENRQLLCSAIQQCKDADSIDYKISGKELQFEVCELQLHLVRHGDDNDFITVSLRKVSVEQQQLKMHAKLQQIEVFDCEGKESLLDIRDMGVGLVFGCENRVSHLYYSVTMQHLYFYISVKLVDQLIHYFYTDVFNMVYIVNHFAIEPRKTPSVPMLINGTVVIAEPVVDIAILGKNDGLVKFNGKSLKAFQKAELVEGVPCFSMKAQLFNADMEFMIDDLTSKAIDDLSLELNLRFPLVFADGINEIFVSGDILTNVEIKLDTDIIQKIILRNLRTPQQLTRCVTMFQVQLLKQ